MQRDFPLFLLNEAEFNCFWELKQKKMENKNEKSSENDWNKCQENLSGIKLSEETRKLLSCHARLIDLYEDLIDIEGEAVFTDPNEEGGIFEKFKVFEEGINDMINISVEVNSVNTSFKEM